MEKYKTNLMQSAYSDDDLLNQYEKALRNFSTAAKKKDKYADCGDYLKKYLSRLNFNFAKEEKEMLFKEMQLRRLITKYSS